MEEWNAPWSTTDRWRLNVFNRPPSIHRIELKDLFHKMHKDQLTPPPAHVRTHGVDMGIHKFGICCWSWDVVNIHLANHKTGKIRLDAFHGLDGCESIVFARTDTTWLINTNVITTPWTRVHAQKKKKQQVPIFSKTKMDPSFFSDSNMPVFREDRESRAGDHSEVTSCLRMVASATVLTISVPIRGGLEEICSKVPSTEVFCGGLGISINAIPPWRNIGKRAMLIGVSGSTSTAIPVGIPQNGGAEIVGVTIIFSGGVVPENMLCPKCYEIITALLPACSLLFSLSLSLASSFPPLPPKKSVFGGFDCFFFFGIGMS